MALPLASESSIYLTGWFPFVASFVCGRVISPRRAKTLVAARLWLDFLPPKPSACKVGREVNSGRGGDMFLQTSHGLGAGKIAVSGGEDVEQANREMALPAVSYVDKGGGGVQML